MQYMSKDVLLEMLGFIRHQIDMMPFLKDWKRNKLSNYLVRSISMRLSCFKMV